MKASPGESSCSSWRDCFRLFLFFWRAMTAAMRLRRRPNAKSNSEDLKGMWGRMFWNSSWMGR